MKTMLILYQRTISISWIAILISLSNSVFSQAEGDALRCNLDAYQPSANIQVAAVDGLLSLNWNGSNEQQLSMQLGLDSGEPIIKTLQLRSAAVPWVTLLTDSRIEYKIVEGLRRISNQQLAPLRSLGIELTQDIVDRHKWDVFWDAPLDLRQQEFRGNPPPAAGIANQ
ncbi:MAG: hypothetical protein IIC60_08805, partial [Proteobacteria bacterium]|nr:hypothetical protein [Pseudomonadota bacterium]